MAMDHWYDYVIVYFIIGWWIGLLLIHDFVTVVFWPAVLLKMAIRGLKEV